MLVASPARRRAPGRSSVDGTQSHHNSVVLRGRRFGGLSQGRAGEKAARYHRGRVRMPAYSGREHPPPIRAVRSTRSARRGSRGPFACCQTAFATVALNLARWSTWRNNTPACRRTGRHQRDVAAWYRPRTVESPVGSPPGDRRGQRDVDFAAAMAVNLDRRNMMGIYRVGKSVDLGLPAQRGQRDDAVMHCPRRAQPSDPVGRGPCYAQMQARDRSTTAKLRSPTRQRHGCELCTDGARAAKARA